MSEIVSAVMEALAVIDESKPHYLLWQPEHESGCECEDPDSMGCNYLNGYWCCGCGWVPDFGPDGEYEDDLHKTYDHLKENGVNV
jgi:hypothetical protein